jgi:hypothetical protein
MSSFLRKSPSGHAKRKRAKEVAALIQSQRGDIHKFFRANTGASVNPNNELAIVAVEQEQPDNANFESSQQEENIDTDTNIGENNVGGSENVCLLVLMNNRFILLIFMIREIGIFMRTCFFTYIFIITVVVSILRPKILVSPRALKILGPALQAAQIAEGSQFLKKRLERELSLWMSAR